MQSSFPFSPHNLQLWFTRATDTTINAEQAIENLLSVTEMERLESTRNTSKRREFLLSRALMRHALSQHFLRQENEWIFFEQPDSPPAIRNLPENIYLSLSHSNDLICFAISSCPIGIDLEAVDKQRDFLKLAKVIMTDDEIDCLVQDAATQADHFYRIWCAKEAYYKALPSSEQSKTSLNKLLLLNLIKGNADWLLIEGKIEQFRLAVVIRNRPEKINCNHFLPANRSTKVVWRQL